MMVPVQLPQMHKTRRLLLETAIREISIRGISNISSEEILEITGVSRGSLYHHFTDYAELIETAQFTIIKDFIAAASIRCLAAIRENRDPNKAHESLLNVVATAHRSEPGEPDFSPRIRTLRLELFVQSLTSPRLHTLLQEFQDSISEKWIEALEICKDRGWTKVEMDSHSTSILIQSTFFGRTLDDFNSKKMELAEWTKTIQEFLSPFFFSKVL